MAATQKTTSKTGTNASAQADALKKLQAGKTPAPAPTATPPKAALKQAISDKSCITALEKAMGFGKSALHLEIAVALSIFCYSDNGADREAKRHLMEIYKEAGFDINPNGEDYKTVNRRINASAAFFDKEGPETFLGAMEGMRDGKAIEALKNHLTMEYNFNGINALLAAAGKPVKQYNTPERQAAAAEAAKEADKSAAGQPTRQPESTQAQAPTPQDQATATAIGERVEAARGEQAQGQARRINDAPNSVLLATEHLHLAIPRDITREELQEMALKIMAFAADMDFEAEAKKGQKQNAAQTQH